MNEFENQREKLKQELLAGLPPAGSIKQRAIDFALDQIRKGNEVAHYKEVLRKLTDRTNRIKH